ncbi:MAG: hypothetical protein EOP47_21490 [Sphingobacteriaceae bacterium]|nr:MAG: hypothetical protein EOP47_21490 [Sphingobacteriaceae bacterium]
MKKIILSIIAIVSISLYVVSSSDKFMSIILGHRASMRTAFGADLRYGDLYNMTFLPAYRDEDPLLHDVRPDTTSTIKRDINLYAIGNSYLLTFVKSHKIFNGVKKFWGGRYYLPESPVLDTTQKNILLIEMTERSVGIFADTKTIAGSFTTPAPKSPADTLPVLTRSNPVVYQSLKNKVFNPQIQKKLEFNLFDYRFLTPIKELKATINYKFFNRLSPDVSVSPDKTNLFLAATVDSVNRFTAITDKYSSFNKIDDQEIDSLIASFNKLYIDFKARGFDEVYLSIIPNPATIISPKMGTYNNLIARIQYNPTLKMPYVDVYKKFKATNQRIYQAGDTHWNNRGFKMWVDEFNKLLANAYMPAKKG